LRLRDFLKLIVITDEKLKPDVVRSVREALEGGATSIQLRLKESSTKRMVEVGKSIRRLTREFGALYFVDDRIDVALATDADGVQLGPEDMPLDLARGFAPNLIIGASVYSLEEALEAERLGADFLGAGSVYPSPSKPNAKIIGLNGLRRIVESVRIPVVAVGGINHTIVCEVVRTGIAGVAVISAVMGSSDVRRATAELRKLIEECLRET